jgi:AraC-like DNA-binding protein
VCGFLGSEEEHNPLLAGLPRVLKLDIKQAASREWIEASVRFAARELSEGQFPSSSMNSRLSELLLVEAVRSYSASLPDEETGWLKGIRDPYIGRALALLHSRPNEPWTAETIGREVGLSRSAFNGRFVSLVGAAPIRYLTLRRLQLAKEKLRDGRDSIAQIAHAVGYESVEAFNRTFKREFGEPPARWRKSQPLGDLSSHP